MEQKNTGSYQPTGGVTAEEVQRFQARLSRVIKSELIPEWLATPNDAFDGLKPLELIERGEMGPLWDMIFYLESGIAS
jgi:hypothetical protein